MNQKHCTWAEKSLCVLIGLILLLGDYSFNTNMSRIQTTQNNPPKLDQFSKQCLKSISVMTFQENNTSTDTELQLKVPDFLNPHFDTHSNSRTSLPFAFPVLLCHLLSVCTHDFDPLLWTTRLHIVLGCFNKTVIFVVNLHTSPLILSQS